MIYKLNLGVIGEVEMKPFFYHWVDHRSKCIGLKIIGDGTLPCGIRVHVVDESFVNARLLHNANIISKDMLNG